MKFLLMPAVAALLHLVAADGLTGRWQSKPSEKGNVTSALFKPDSTFEGYVNNKPFVSGRYQLQGDTLSFTDNGCQGMQGVYKLLFFHHADSLRFEAISDSCTERKGGMQRLVLGRVK